MRYFVKLSYKGTDFHGWQKQPTAVTVQQTIEEALSRILRQPTPIVGCGRTDTGVHASQYYLHFDAPALPEQIVHKLNQILPPSVVIRQIFSVLPDANARYDATQRAYTYHITYRKDPFKTDTAYYYPFRQKPNLQAMQAVASLLLKYDSFYPFCKSGSDVKHMRCHIQESQWHQPDENHVQFDISANRFLRGMVRLIVGISLQVGLQKVSLDEVRKALENQTRLQKSYSVPPQGLFLVRISYPFVS